MDYRLGVDLGTTYTAAAVLQGDEPQIVPLGDHEAFVPSVVVLQRDLGLLVGEPAERRAVTSPRSTAREFKRRLGDPTPVILDGVPYSAHALMAKVLGWVLERVSAREGGPPIAVAVTYPANWGEYRRDVLAQAILQSGVEVTVFVTEPEAAAIRYASIERIQTGDVIGVYDFGGGTFDAAIMRRGPDAFELLGRPAGVEQLGGVDIDEAVFAHVRRVVGEEAFELDTADAAVAAALHQLRRDCVLAKEALSYDTETAIPVNLPGAHTLVRLTRADLEDMIRPLVAETVGAFRRALTSSGCSPEDLSAVLLAGGSSRIPLVGEMLSADLGRPVTVDAHPKHIVALGAAMRAAPMAAPGAPRGEWASAPTGPGAGGGDAVVEVAVRIDDESVNRPGSDVAGVQDGGHRASGSQRPMVTVHAVAVPRTPDRETDAGGRLGLGRWGRNDVAVPAAAAAGLGVVTLLLAFVGIGGKPQGDVTLSNGAPSAAASVRLEDPIRVAVNGQPLTSGQVQPSLAGIGFGTERIAADGTVSLSGLKHVLAGPAEVSVRPEGGRSASRAAVVEPAGGLGTGGLLSIPGVAGLALMLFGFAYAESFLRAVRRRRRTSTGTLFGMGMVGIASGIGAAFVGWTLGGHVLSMPLVLLCALTGLAASLTFTVALSRVVGAGRPS